MVSLPLNGVALFNDLKGFAAANIQPAFRLPLKIRIAASRGHFDTRRNVNAAGNYWPAMHW